MASCARRRRHLRRRRRHRRLRCDAATTAATTTAATAGAGAGAKPLTEDEIFQRKTLAELNAEMPLGDVCFDYDMSTIRDDARPILQKNADYMRRWTTTRVTVEGHADARGTAEYNLALGERRGSAFRDYLVSVGDSLPRTTNGDRVRGGRGGGTRLAWA